MGMMWMHSDVEEALEALSREKSIITKGGTEPVLVARMAVRLLAQTLAKADPTIFERLPKTIRSSAPRRGRPRKHPSLEESIEDA